MHTFVQNRAQKQPLYHQIIQLALEVSSPPVTFNKGPYTATKDDIFYPDLDTGASGGTQPVTVGAEAEGVDGVSAVQGVEVLALIQVPEHGLAVLQEKIIDTTTIFRNIVDY